ncbi:3-hydroxyacyl-CoA dehydrogenase NAD-binding domain-containing protein [Rhodococcus qingshengii]|uniref:3-hydroxyacyl-CoA dehydrogenase NAD-binding domain-containing protein n=1 Tax=Rhodococcus qingshengii TaxID=334542 RepID=UPI0035E0D69E
MTLVTIERREGIAILALDNPPVNTGNSAQRAALLAAITEIREWPELSGVVLTTAGKHFYAGSDLKEFDKPLAEPQLPHVIAALDALEVPVVAAIRGLALGGGLELALGCDIRLATPDAQFGFPEVEFGIVPGAGGTVRAPRLIGVEAAFDMVTTARRVPGGEARALGLVNEIVDAGELLSRAIEYARSSASRNRLVDVGPVSSLRNELLARLPRRHRPNVRIAGELVIEGVSRPAPEALSRERAVFEELRVSHESESLRYLFFARQAAAKSLRVQARPRTVQRVGVIGAGTMGAGLARLFAGRGYDVVVVDADHNALGRLKDDAVTTATSLDACAECDLVIEAVFEDMDVKRGLFTDLEAIVASDTLLVTNTSYLDPSEMSAALRHPHRFGGMHFFNPPERNTLVEIIPTSTTDEATTATLGAVAVRLGKVALPSGVGDGFIGNRVYADYRTQAEFLVEDGASPVQVDRAMELLGMAIGPFAVADMSGLDIAWARRKRHAATQNPRQRYVRIPDLLCESGRLGKKTKAGWYAYPDGVRRGVEDPIVSEIIDACRGEAGVAPRAIDADEIQSRILAAMIAGAATVVHNAVARRASDVDVALTEGFAFPRYLGGPVKAFSRFSYEEQLAALTATFNSDPVTYKVLAEAVAGVMPGPVATLLNGIRISDH